MINVIQLVKYISRMDSYILLTIESDYDIIWNMLFGRSVVDRIEH